MYSLVFRTYIFTFEISRDLDIQFHLRYVSDPKHRTLNTNQYNRIIIIKDRMLIVFFFNLLCKYKYVKSWRLTDLSSHRTAIMKS